MQILVGFIWGMIGGGFTANDYPLIPTLLLAMLGYILTMAFIRHKDII